MTDFTSGEMKIRDRARVLHPRLVGAMSDSRSIGLAACAVLTIVAGGLYLAQKGSVSAWDCGLAIAVVAWIEIELFERYKHSVFERDALNLVRKLLPGEQAGSYNQTRDADAKE